MADGVERAMDAAGIGLADLAGNSLGGHVALQLAARGRARSVVALAPAGGWAADDPLPAGLTEHFLAMRDQARNAAPQAPSLLATPEGRRMATRAVCERSDHIPAGLIIHQMLGIAACPELERLTRLAESAPWTLDAALVTCPVRVVWGAADRVLPWPRAAVRHRTEWLPQADWVVLDGVGHCPQLDAPAETADLILGWTVA
jgi:pimeloyl-ACP methyl ester carboxylesterase